MIHCGQSSKSNGFFVELTPVALPVKTPSLRRLEPLTTRKTLLYEQPRRKTLDVHLRTQSDVSSHFCYLFFADIE